MSLCTEGRNGTAKSGEMLFEETLLRRVRSIDAVERMKERHNEAQKGSGKSKRRLAKKKREKKETDRVKSRTTVVTQKRAVKGKEKHLGKWTEIELVRAANATNVDANEHGQSNRKHQLRKFCQCYA